MPVDTEQKLKHELNSLQGLSITNLVCSSLVMAFGIYFLIPNLISIVTTKTVDISQVGLVIFGALVFAIAVRWLMSSAIIVDTTSKIATALSKHKKNKTLDDEALTGLIVDMTATYRENKPTIEFMTAISKIAGVCFTIVALFTSVSIIIGVLSGTEIWSIIISAINMAISLVIAFTCFVIPHFFAKYSTLWNKRLDEAAKVEAALEKQLGEDR